MAVFRCANKETIGRSGHAGRPASRPVRRHPARRRHGLL